jgi:orotate phosphoribosyltransferase-like protein
MICEVRSPTRTGEAMRSNFTEFRNIKDVLGALYMDSQEIFSVLSNMSSEEILHIIKLAGGFWRHNCDPKAPHAVLRSGKHSDGFIALPEALKYVAINNLFASLLVIKIKAQNSGQIDWVVGSDHSAATLSYAVASRLSKEHLHNDVKHDFTEKAEVGGKEVQKWSRHVIGRHERVFHLEELCTTNLTLLRVRTGIASFHPSYPVNYVPVIGMAVNRTGSDNYEGVKIASLVDVKFKEYDVKNGEECKLCKGGSEPLENVKKSAATWAKLTGRLGITK